jgi:hypothetical protein
MIERQWAPTTARIWFALTAVAVLAGVVISVWTAVVTGGQPWDSGVARAFNSFAYFTTQSNLIVGATVLLLALRLDRTSTLFRVFRLDGLVMIVITGVVFHTMLAGLLELQGWASAGNQLVHTAVPIMAVLGWLLFGPRGLISWRTIGLSVIYPILWVVFTMTRGALTDWYPYPFLQVDEVGVLSVALTLLGITVAFVLLGIGGMYLDRLLLRTARRRTPRRRAEAPMDRRDPATPGRRDTAAAGRPPVTPAPEEGR